MKPKISLDTITKTLVKVFLMAITYVASPT